MEEYQKLPPFLGGGLLAGVGQGGTQVCCLHLCSFVEEKVAMQIRCSCEKKEKCKLQGLREEPVSVGEGECLVCGMWFWSSAF